MDNKHLGGCLMDGDPLTFMPDIWIQLLETYEINSVLDIGCGPGKNLEWFQNKGLKVLGIEGWKEAIKHCKIPVIEHDYTKGGLEINDNYDLCICTEFVEHVEQQFEQNWFKTILSAKYVLLCHGLPGQNGYHHVNCQNSTYWIERFEQNGYTINEELSKKFQLTGLNVSYGRNTLMFFERK